MSQTASWVPFDENLPENLQQHSRRGGNRSALQDVTNDRAFHSNGPQKPMQSKQAASESVYVDTEMMDSQDVPQPAFRLAAGTQSGETMNVSASSADMMSRPMPMEDLSRIRSAKHSKTASMAGIPQFYNIDARTGNDAQFVLDYIEDIVRHQKLTECLFRCGPNYIDRSQTDINASMRAILIDWLNEVAQEYNLKQETLHLSVNIIDRFLSAVPVARSRLQLVGVTGMLIAAKYEEIVAPTVEEFVYITDNTYSREDVLKTEGQMLNILRFNITAVTIMDFLPRFLRAGNADSRVSQLALFLSELTLQEYQFLHYTPSMIAAAAVSLALHTCGLLAWTPTLEYYTSYTVADVRSCVAEMHSVFRNAEYQSLQAVREKYSHSKYMRVSTIPCPQALPPMFL
eukprot:ANDGO_06145.mRNA.1 Cyclin-A1-1